MCLDEDITEEIEYLELILIDESYFHDLQIAIYFGCSKIEKGNDEQF